MISTMRKITSFLLLSSAVALTGCGGGGGGATPAPLNNSPTAAITESNSRDMGITSLESSQASISSDTAGGNNPLFPVGATMSGIEATKLGKIITDISEGIQAQNLPAGIIEAGTCGGTVSYPDNLQSTTQITMTFTNYCVNDPAQGDMFFNGAVTLSATATSFTMTYTDFSVTINGVVETINSTFTCDNSFISCSISASYVGSDGLTYQVTDYTVDGDPTLGYSISGTFVHPMYGTVDFQTTVSFTFGCPGGKPDSGTIEFNGASNSSGSISFRSDCSGYDGTWNDGTTSGTFSGNWI